MRIGIDGRFLNHPESGHGTYSRELISNLAEIDSENEYYVFVSPGYKPEINQSNFHFIKTDIPYYSIAEQTKLPFILKKYQLDLMHFVHFNKPILYRASNVITIHDLTLTHFKGEKSNPIKQFFYKLIIGSAIKSSDSIIAISEFTKQEILKNYSVSEEKISVIYEGFHPQFRKIGNKSLIKETISGYNITKPYIIYIGQQRPHKNLVRLVNAFSQVRQKGLDYQLVLVGKKNPKYEQLNLEIKKQKLTQDVIFTGFAEDKELPKLINGARLLVMPSLMEGFGLPVLEGLACDVPVAASRISSLPEVGGQAVNYFDPYDSKDMAKIIYNTLTDKNLRTKLLDKSANQLKKFSWSNMADQVKQLYESFLPH